MSDEGQKSFQSRIRRLEASKKLDAEAVDSVRPMTRRAKRRAKRKSSSMTLGFICGAVLWAAGLLTWVLVDEQILPDIASFSLGTPSGEPPKVYLEPDILQASE